MHLHKRILIKFPNNIYVKLTFFSAFERLTLFQQNASLSASITLNIGRLNEIQRHSALSIVEGELSFREVARIMGS